MNINEYLTSQRDLNDEKVYMDNSFPLAKRITCNDGFSLSVQATHGAYCRPRHNIGPWYMVEVGFPSAKPEFFSEYAEYYSVESENDLDYTKMVYGYVPIELVEQCIEAHGGIKLDEKA